MRKLRKVTLEFDDGDVEVLEGRRAEAWRREVDRALTVATLKELEETNSPAWSRTERPGSSVWDFLEDMGEMGVSVLLHLHRNGGMRALTSEDISEELGITVEDVEEVLDKLRGWGVLEDIVGESYDGQD
jgi:biotin operon repressor